MPDVQYVEVPLRAVDFRDERFRISRDKALEDLVESIREIGLVNPPVVCSRGRGYVLVTGWKRALACRSLDFQKITTLVTSVEDDRSLLLLAINENLATRELGLTEKAAALLKLRQFGMADDVLIREYLPRLSLHATGAELRRMVALAGAGRIIQDFVSAGSFSPAVIKALLRFRAEDIRPLLPLLRALGQNKQRQVLEDLWDIVRRDGVSARSLLRRKEFRRVIASPRLSALQKADGIRQLLRKIRYPKLSAREEAFRSTLREVRWPGDVSVQPSPYFEEDQVTVSFRVGSRKELLETLDKLEKVAGRKGLAGLFRERG